MTQKIRMSGERPGILRRFKNWLLGEGQPELDFEPDRETILLARDFLLARRARLGFLNFFFVPPRNRYELVRDVRLVCARTGIHEDEALGWLGLDRNRFADWTREFPVLEERFAREDETRDTWQGLVHRPGTLLITAGVTLLCAILVALFLDRPAVYFFDQFDQTSPAMKIWVHITFAGDSTLFYLFGIFGVFLTWTRDRQLARGLLFVLLVMTLSGLCVNLIKFGVGRPRPELFLRKDLWGLFQFSFETLTHVYETLSFPSGHATHSSAVGVALALLMPRYRYLFLLYPLLVGISRVVLVQHFPSDVLGGWFVGGLVTLLVYDRMYPDQLPEVGQGSSR